VQVVVKKALETFLVAGGVARLSRRRRRQDALILAYHNIVPHGLTGFGDSSLHLSVRAFEAQLDHLRRHFDVVDLDSILETDPTERPRVAITFDDAYRGALTLGVQSLVQRDLPATFFVPPGLLGSGPFWWDAFADRVHGAPEPAFRAQAIVDLAGQTSRIREHTGSSGMVAGSLPPEFRIATLDELSRAASQTGVTLGSHSWSHPNLCALDGEALAEELERPLAWLQARFDAVTSWVSYPYGLSDARVAEVAGSVGYTAGLRIEGGWLTRRDSDRFSFPRLNVPAGLSNEGFALRAAGLSSE
jgi:peptidoglycan/xylan/chitin deacetylase (PgdA/CDA1 family)